MLTYHVVNIKPKNTEIEKAKMLDWRQGHLSDNWHANIFNDETTVYLDNPGKTDELKMKGKYNLFKIEKEKCMSSEESIIIEFYISIYLTRIWKVKILKNP